MGGKRNKLRYQSKGNQFPPLILSGRVVVKYEDEEVRTAPAIGDLRLYLNTDTNPAIEQGVYDCIGLDGYLKLEVWDGKGWKMLSAEEFFPHREYYYSKHERPMDTMAVCLPILTTFKGRTLLRTYREHYILIEEE